VEHDSYWAVTEAGPHGNPLVVTGILQEQTGSIKSAETEKKSVIDNLKVQALRAHLNPHLIFNCLTGLRAMIKSNPELAREFTSRLARFLRAVVDSQTSTLISLTHEIDICMDYIALESMRGKKIHLDYQPQHQEKSIFLPPLSLVTLVENAVKHGQRDKSGTLSLELQCHRNGTGVDHIILRHAGIIQDKSGNELPGGLSLLKQQLKTVHHPSSRVQLLQPSSHIVEARIELTVLPS
jgi:LytS/YehU family sensor histidine kinase